MKKIFKLLSVLLVVGLFVGCSCSKNKKLEPVKEQTPTVEDTNKYDGLEFINVSAENNLVKTIIINNTGYLYEGSKFKMKIMDGSGNVIVELIDEVKEKMETGTTLEIQTDAKTDLSNASSIEYSIIK